MKKRLTEWQFERALKYMPALQEETAAMAHQVLVKGVPAASVATEYAVSRQFVAERVKRIYDVYLEHCMNCPEGWHSVSVCVPEEDVQAVRDMEKAAKKRYKIK